VHILLVDAEAGADIAQGVQTLGAGDQDEADVESEPESDEPVEAGLQV
jgi:hypothetical protein